MLAIARALMSRPKLLMLDEPSLGLAPLIVKQIFSTLAELNRQGMTIFVVEQNAFHALRLAHRGYVLVNGVDHHERHGTGSAFASGDPPGLSRRRTALTLIADQHSEQRGRSYDRGVPCRPRIRGLADRTAPTSFVLLTVCIGGWAAWRTGQAQAQSWAPAWPVVAYTAVLAAAVRFLHFALFSGPLLSPIDYLVDLERPAQPGLGRLPHPTGAAGDGAVPLAIRAPRSPQLGA